MTDRSVLTAGAITSAVSAVITVLVSFGLPITPDQTNAVLGVVAVVAPFVLAWLTRHRTDEKLQ